MQEGDNIDQFPQIYTARYIGPKKEYILAGGSEPNVAKVVSVHSGKVVSEFKDFAKPVLVSDISPDCSAALIGCADGTIHVKNLL